MGNGEKLSQQKLLIKRGVRQLPQKPPVMHLTRPTPLENGERLRKQVQKRRKKKKKNKNRSKNQGEDLFTVVIFITLASRILVFKS